MDARNVAKSSKPKKKLRFIKYIVIVLLILIVLAVVLLPVYISSNGGNAMILGKINQSIDGKVAMDSLSMGWFKGVEIEGLDFNDNEGLTKVTIEKLSTKPSYLSFLGESPNLGKTIIDTPKIYVKLKDSAAAKEKTEADMSKPADYSDTEKAAGAAGMFKIDLEVIDGDVVIETESGQMLKFSQLGAKVDLKGLNKDNKFDVSVAVDDDSGNKPGIVIAKGNVLPGEDAGGWSLEGTSGEFNVQVDKLRLGSLAPLLKLMGAGVEAEGVVDANFSAMMEKGQIDSVDGKVDCANIDILIGGAGGDRIKSEKLNADVKVVGGKESYNFDKLNITSDWLVVNGSGKLGKKEGGRGEFEARFNFDIASAAQSMPATFSVREGVNITGGTFSGNLLCIANENERDFVAKASLEGLTALAEGKPIALSKPIDFDVDLKQDKGGWQIKKGMLTSGFAQVNCSGNAAELDYLVNADMSSLQKEVGQFFDFGGYSFAGNINQDGKAKFGDDMVSFKGQTQISDFVVTKDGRTASEPSAVINYDMNLDKAKEELSIATLKFDGGAGNVAIDKSKVFIGEGKGQSNIKIDADIELGKIVPFVIMAGALGSEYGIEGRLKSKADIAINGDTVGLKTTGSRIERPNFTYNKDVLFKQDFVELDFDGSVDTARQSVAVDSMRLISPQIKITKGSVKKTQSNGMEKVEGNFDYDVNLVSISDIVDPFLPEGFELYGREVDSVNFSSQYPADKPDKMLEHLNASTKFGFEKASYMGLNFGRTDVNVEIVNGVMSIKPFSTAVNEGKINFAAGANFGKNPVILRTPGPMLMMDKIHIDEEMANKMLKYLNPMFSQITSVTGLLNFNCDRMSLPLSSGFNDKIVVEGTVSMNDVRISGGGLVSQITQVTGVHNPNVAIEILPTKFVLENGKLHYDDMQINFGDTPLNFTGNVFMDKAMSMSVTLPWTIAGKTAKAGEDAGRRIKLAIAGKVDAPMLDTSKLIEEVPKQIIEEEAGKILDKLFK